MLNNSENYNLTPLAPTMYLAHCLIECVFDEVFQSQLSDLNLPTY